MARPRADARRARALAAYRGALLRRRGLAGGEGLEGGETVVTDGQLRVIPGGKVAVAPPQKAAAP